MNVSFDQPTFLWLALVAIPIIVLGYRWLDATDALRRTVVTTLRAGLVIAVAVMLAGPRRVTEHDHLTVIGILDVSESVRRFARLPAADQLDGASNMAYLRQWFRTVTATRTPDDRFGLIVFDGSATVVSVPDRGDYLDDNLDVRTLPGTNIAEAIRLALALLPADTGKRLVLVSDGVATAGDVLDAAREAAAGVSGGVESGPGAISVPIDIVPVEYQVSNDVQVVRVESPPIAQPGQVITVRVVLDAAAPAIGRLTLQHEGQAVDLNGEAPGTSRLLTVPTGLSVHVAQVELGETPINRFVAVYEPADPAADALIDNNSAEAFTATPSRGAVLVVDPQNEVRPNPLVDLLLQAEIPTTVVLPSGLGDDLLTLQRYDLIVLDNVGAAGLDPAQHELLVAYVTDSGGGLIMIGGDNSFGAGGWNGTALEAVLPLELDPPKEARLPAAALVLVLDKSGSMNRPVAGTRTSQQRIANEAAALAIESLRGESYIGVVTFDFGAHNYVPIQLNEDPTEIAVKVRGIVAEGGTNMYPALEQAHAMLKSVDCEKKRVVCLSDGQSMTTDFDHLVDAMAADNIQITTIAVGDDADIATLRRIADRSGGEFHRVMNPRTLPRVLVESVQVINKPLLKEAPFVPTVRSTGSTLTASMGAAPQLGGLVITSERDDATAVIEMTHPDGEPLLAHWQAGIGRVAAFTSEVSGPWSARWVGWPGAATFWTQLVRNIARPPASRDTELTTFVDGDRLNIALDVASDEDGFLDYLNVEGWVYRPDGEAVRVRLRQTAPGQYETSVDATLPGNYVVALSPRRGARRLAPVIGGATQSTNPEYRRFHSNRSVLEQIAAISGGRVLDVLTPEDVDVFDRTGMEPSTSALPAWRTVLWLALIVLLIDIAARRLAWDAALFKRWLAMAIQRVTPAHVRGAQAATTLASLRTVSQQVEQQIGKTTERPAAKTATKPQMPTAAARGRADGGGGEDAGGAGGAPSPTRRQVAAGLAALLGRKTSRPEDTTAPKPSKSSSPSSSTPTGADEDSTTDDDSARRSGLLAAKRRARERMERRDDEDTGR